MKKTLLLKILVFLVTGCNSVLNAQQNKNHQTETLVIQKITDHFYQHTSYLHTDSFGKVPYNGMIVFDYNEAIVFDTPADSEASLELIKWVQKELKCKITAIIPTHFHEDCVAGLAAFHLHGVPSYAHTATIELARLNNKTIPENKFDQQHEFKVGKQKVKAEFFGVGHTRDNVIGYFPGEKVLFGGCLIKEMGAGKGNLEDANTIAWPKTVAQLKQKYPDATIIIPGHGQAGGPELLDYTIKLFAAP